MESKELAVQPEMAIAPRSADEVIQQVALIQQVMKKAMREKEHFGTIPGCGDKPTLLKPGAEKLCLTFRMAPKYRIDVRDLPKGHRAYEVVCELYMVGSGDFLGEGVGNCSTMESKYRFRTGPKEYTDKPVPAEYWDTRKTDPAGAQKLIGGKGHGTGKNDVGQWVITIQGEKMENDNPADQYNTVLKIGKKRAMVDAVLTATAASDIFTQDLEEMVENGVIDADYTVVEKNREHPMTKKLEPRTPRTESLMWTQPNPNSTPISLYR